MYIFVLGNQSSGWSPGPSRQKTQEQWQKSWIAQGRDGEGGGAGRPHSSPDRLLYYVSLWMGYVSNKPVNMKCHGVVMDSKSLSDTDATSTHIYIYTSIYTDL